MHSPARHPSRQLSRRFRTATGAAALCLALTACGGSDSDLSDSDLSDSDLSDSDVSDSDLSDLDVSDLDTSGLDDGQVEILEDVLEDGFAEDAPSPVVGVRVAGPYGVDTITDSFPDELSFPDVDVMGFPENHQTGLNTALADDGIWVATDTTLHRFSIDDGTEAATVSVEAVIPGDEQAEFVGIDGDETGLFALVNGFDASVIVEIDPISGAIVTTHDVNTAGLRGAQLVAGPTHVAVTTNGSAPIKVLDRTNGTISEIGQSDAIKGIAVTSDRLAISNSVRNVNDPFTYDVHSLADGSLITSGDLPYGDSTLRTHGDRIIQEDPNFEGGPLFEVDPQGTPIAEFLPAGIVQILDWVEADGVIYITIRCCLFDEFGNDLGTIAIDAATGALLGGDQTGGQHIILP